METYILGVREFLLKENPSTLPEARRRLQRIYYMIQAGKVIAVVVAIQQAHYHYPTAKHLWNRFGLPLLNAVLLRKNGPAAVRV
jgi:hypothetical protein